MANIGSGNGLSHLWYQALTCTNADCVKRLHSKKIKGNVNEYAIIYTHQYVCVKVVYAMAAIMIKLQFVNQFACETNKQGSKILHWRFACEESLWSYFSECNCKSNRKRKEFCTWFELCCVLFLLVDFTHHLYFIHIGRGGSYECPVWMNHLWWLWVNTWLD